MAKAPGDVIQIHGWDSVTPKVPITIANPVNAFRVNSWVTLAIPDIHIPDEYIMYPQGWEVYIGESISVNARLIHIKCGQINPYEQVWGELVPITGNCVIVEPTDPIVVLED